MLLACPSLNPKKLREKFNYVDSIDIHDILHRLRAEPFKHAIHIQKIKYNEALFLLFFDRKQIMSMSLMKCVISRLEMASPIIGR